MLLRVIHYVCLVLIFFFSNTEAHGNFYPDKDRKIALLFLTNGDLTQSVVWKTLLENSIYKKKFTLYVNSRKPLKDKYFKKFRIRRVTPITCSRNIFSWHTLLQEALLDTRNYKFVFLSESCLPLQPLDRIYERLISNNNTLMFYCKPWWDSCNRDILELPLNHRFANHEWVILNRTHAELLVQDENIIRIISDYDYSQESWPSSALSFFGALDEVENRQTTYVNCCPPFSNANTINCNLIRDAKRNGFLFGREFTKHFPEKDLLNLITSEP